jgi:tRNA(Ile)-lysidine synthase
MSILTRVSEFARRHALWRPDTRAIAAVSGGSDSVALLLLLRDLHARGELVLDAVAHLNHMTRAEASNEDEAFCRELARSLALPFVTATIDVPAAARLQRQSIEVAAREARQQFFEDVLRARGATCVATAHTQDDQAETVLLRMVRGSGIRGLGGMAPARRGRVRPLLTCTRQVLRDELMARNQVWREDATNADVSNVRNRVRHELLPYLERHFNPSVREALVRLADLARADEAALTRDAAAATFQVLRSAGSGAIRLDGPVLESLPAAVARRVVQCALEMASGGVSHGIDDIDAVRSVAHGHRAAVEVSGVRAEHSAGSVVLLTKGPGRSPAPFEFNLSVPGVVEAPDAAWVLEACGPKTVSSDRPIGRSPDEVELDAAHVPGPLIVRSRLPGDRIRPLGSAGRKKLQDVFVDRKVSPAARNQVPVVTDPSGRIVWVAGHVLNEDFKVTDRTKAVIILRLRRMERLGT